MAVEERIAAQWAGYSWKEYTELPGSDRWVSVEQPDSKAAVIAAYRQWRRMEFVKGDVPPPPKHKPK